MIQEQRLVQTFLELVQLDSESKQERLVADYVTAKLRALGYTVKEDEAGAQFGGNAGNVLAYKAGSCAGKSLLFCAHMDTVAPGNHVKPIVEDGVIRSDGSTVLGGDDKAGIAAILEAAAALEESGRQPWASADSVYRSRGNRSAGRKIYRAGAAGAGGRRLLF